MKESLNLLQELRKLKERNVINKERGEEIELKLDQASRKYWSNMVGAMLNHPPALEAQDEAAKELEDIEKEVLQLKELEINLGKEISRAKQKLEVLKG